MEVWHLSGAGNDFMVIDSRKKTFDYAVLAKKLCALTHADGFMAVSESDRADFKLHFYNSDGSRGEMCGNGSRCICKFAHDKGIAGDTMTVETDAGLIYGRRLGDELYRVKLNNPGVLDLHRTPEAAYAELGTPGVPHAVVELPGLTWEQAESLRDRAAALRRNPAFPRGANVNFYTWLDDTTVRVLTYERGVEDYTLACGTGCGSLAAVLYASGRLPGGQLTALNRGGILHLTVEGQNGAVTALYLEGPAVLIKIYDISL